jgi:BirA family biotin operon repressor/biotin-[acetyl-CoA-carboxylase] ligase
MISEKILINKLRGAACGYKVSVFDTVTSTNTLLREMAKDGADDGTVIIAGHQTAGRGRMGRRFYSPSDTGIYISVLLHPDTDIKNAIYITTHAAVSACMAIEKTTDRIPQIKWVNDIFIDGKKVCGILTEAVFDSGKIKYAVMGIGFNVYPPDGGFPNEISDIAGAICSDKQDRLREEIAAEFLNRFSECHEIADISREYKKRSAVIGKTVDIINTATGDSYRADVEDIDDECRLVIKDSFGNRKALSSGEIRIKI